MHNLLQLVYENLQAIARSYLLIRWNTYQRISHRKEASYTGRNIIMFLVCMMIEIIMLFWWKGSQ